MLIRIPPFFLLLCLLAAFSPWLRGTSQDIQTDESFPGWPSSFDGRPLTALPLSSLEASLQREFPGRIGRFSDGRREIILRWLNRETRQLHASSDCFKANGYRVDAQPIKRLGAERWSTFRASRGNTQLIVTERIYNEAGHQWSDVSAWYWAAQLGRSRGPWWAVTVAERGENG